MVQVGPNVNQYNETSNPIVVRVYQLSSRTEFEAATFWEIFDSRSSELAGVVLDRRSLSPFFPGETRAVVLDLVPDVFFLGAFVEFSDFENQKYQATVPIDARRLDKGVAISVTASGVSIQFRKPSGALESQERRTGFLGRVAKNIYGLLGLG